MLRFFKHRRLKYYLQLAYPKHITWCDHGFKGEVPDLPGCEAFATDLQTLYIRLEQARGQWISEQLCKGRPVPMPNSGTRTHAHAGEGARSGGDVGVTGDTRERGATGDGLIPAVNSGAASRSARKTRTGAAA